MYYDFCILQHAIKYELFYFEDIEYYTKNPMTYSGLLDVSIYINRNFAPLEERLKSIIAVEEEATAVFSVAKANLAGFSR